MKQVSNMPGDAMRLKALRMLVAATAFWGLSFPTTKALAVSQQALLPDSSSWFAAALCVVFRFVIAALVLLVFSARSLTRLTRLELEQGLGLGVFGGVGILLQVDGTIAASLAFTGQIFLLERPQYAGNNVRHFSLVMFVAMAAVGLPVAVATTPQWGDWFQAYRSAPTLGFLAILVFFCTCGGYLLMNHWQRRVTATQAGLIYCLEPVFASAFALFLPAWFSTWAAMPYANERLSASLLVGGGLITAANVLIQLPSSAPRQAAANIATLSTDQRNGQIPGRLDDTASS